MFKRRNNEPVYAVLPDTQAQSHNRYGAPIDLCAENDMPRGTSLRINGDLGVGDNPNRNKQHGFHFTADNCIGCHACEAACSEKNDLPPHLAFRSVGYVEGGSWPDYTRINISMACNHCDNPVCLKGCPTRAYTKHPEYGAVIQDPDICFGCGYCTWVCPYNAPQLDPLAGHVQKCNMCVDRLEVGLKPACVSACLGNALNFGIIENTPEGRQQAKTEIPGFPDPSITHPNIRFQQLKSIPRDFTRPDSAPIKYHRDDASGVYTSEADGAKIPAKSWGPSALSSRENPLVIFTLITQGVIGAFALAFLLGAALDLPSLKGFWGSWGSLGFLTVLLGLQGFALFLSTLHLGRPLRFYRGFNNLRYSPLSREALGVALFFGFMGATWLMLLVKASGVASNLDPLTTTLAMVFGALAVLAGVGGIYFMTRIYKIKARPFWNHWQVTASFFATALTVGGVVFAFALAASGFCAPYSVSAAIAIGLVLEGVGLAFHARDLKRGGGEGWASFSVQTTRFSGAYGLRNVLFLVNFLAVTALAITGVVGVIGGVLWAVALVSIVCAALIGRALFYVLVIPTTMPGAFFWKNKGFEEHARETGLAAMPQCGVPMKAH